MSARSMTYGSEAQPQNTPSASPSSIVLERQMLKLPFATRMSWHARPTRANRSSRVHG